MGWMGHQPCCSHVAGSGPGHTDPLRWDQASEPMSEVSCYFKSEKKNMPKISKFGKHQARLTWVQRPGYYWPKLILQCRNTVEEVNKNYMISLIKSKILSVGIQRRGWDEGRESLDIGRGDTEESKPELKNFPNLENDDLQRDFCLTLHLYFQLYIVHCSWENILGF